MRPIFTIHAGEYLVGEFLEKKFKKAEVWVPSKDTGVDLLMTNSKSRSKNIAIQVKFSKDFLPAMNPMFHEKLVACGWWTLNLKKMEKSTADIWILAPYSFKDKKVHFIVVEPKELYNRLVKIHKYSNLMNTYLWVTKDGRCYETRDLKKAWQEEIISSKNVTFYKKRDFTKYLNRWDLLQNKLGS